MDWGLCFLTRISSCIPEICTNQEENILKCRLSKSHKSWPGYSVHFRDKLHPLPISPATRRVKLVSSLFLSHSLCPSEESISAFPSLLLSSLSVPLSFSLYLFLSYPLSLYPHNTPWINSIPKLSPHGISVCLIVEPARVIRAINHNTVWLRTQDTRPDLRCRLC